MDGLEKMMLKELPFISGFDGGLNFTIESK